MILQVAHRFPIIRFDAAMTLTKRHYQRLWFPEPGTGGDIPSRADHGMTRGQFDALMPNEFWREVVDRVAQEAPDTLLLAEAFWLMEGYFVRTLGMHRVYNSAFMNMLRDEENAKYRSVIKNTLEFDPEVLKRFVNFMNNPDERTAVDQFGKDDKYFGVCTLMVTMPGLPMFGHGQIEGFTEKYGMEYRRAYWDEQPEAHLIGRHQREIFPLLHRRHLFADVQHFLLYDFFTAEGHVNEDVLAYSNRNGGERVLVIYHNRFASARGWIRTSVAYSVKTGEGDERTLTRKGLGEGLGLHAGGDYFCIFRDHVSGLEYIRNSQELHETGLYIELDAYKCHVFLDLHEVRDNEQHHYSHLAAYLNGRGVPSVEEALTETLMQPIRQRFTALVNADMLRRVLDARVTQADQQIDVQVGQEIEQKTIDLLREIMRFTGGTRSETEVSYVVQQRLAAVLQLPVLDSRFPQLASWHDKWDIQHLLSNLDDDPFVWGSLFGWLFVHPLGQIVDQPDGIQRSRSWIDEWVLGKIIAGVLVQVFGMSEATGWQAVTVIKILTTHQGWYRDANRTDPASADKTLPSCLLQSLLEDGDVQQFLQVNRYQGTLWFNKEAFDQLLRWLQLLAVVEISADPLRPPDSAAQEIRACGSILGDLQRAGDQSGYQVEKLLEVSRRRGD
jgi:hypothetical protein